MLKEKSVWGEKACWALTIEAEKRIEIFQEVQGLLLLPWGPAIFYEQ